MNWVSGKQIAVFYPWGNKWPSVSAITKPDPNSEFLNPFASRRQQLFWWNVTHLSLWWSHHVLLIEIRNVDFAISSLYYQSSPIVGTSSTFSISLGATTFHFFTHFKIISTKFPRASCYFSIYNFDEYDKGNYEICFLYQGWHIWHFFKAAVFCCDSLPSNPIVSLLYRLYKKLLRFVRERTKF